MGLIQKYNKLGYKHYSEFKVEELDKLSLENSNKQIEYYFIQKWLREVHSLNVSVREMWQVSKLSGTNRDNDIFYRVTVSNYKLGRDKYLLYIDGPEVGVKKPITNYEEAIELGLFEALKLIKDE